MKPLFNRKSDTFLASPNLGKVFVFILFFFFVLEQATSFAVLCQSFGGSLDS